MMLYAISQELGAALKAKGVPFHVTHAFGNESTVSHTAAHERVVIVEPIGEKKDAIVPPIATRHNPMSPARCIDSATVRIFARSSLAGATGHDHADRARKVRAHVIAELDAIVRGRKNVLTWGAAGFVELEDAHASSVWSGAVYEIDLAIDRSVSRVNWADEANEEVVIGAVAAPGVVPLKTTVLVTDANGAMAPEIASGG